MKFFGKLSGSIACNRLQCWYDRDHKPNKKEEKDMAKLLTVRSLRGDNHVHALGCRDSVNASKYYVDPVAFRNALAFDAGPNDDIARIAAERELGDIACDTCSTDEEFDAYFAFAANDFKVFPCAEKAVKA